MTFCFSDLSCLWNWFLLLTQVKPWDCCIWEGRVTISCPLSPPLSGTLNSFLYLGEGGTGDPGAGNREEKIPELPSRFPFSPTTFMGWWGKLLLWLQLTCKQKRWPWCCNNLGIGDGLNAKRSHKHLFCFLLGLFPYWIHGNVPWLSTGCS